MTDPSPLGLWRAVSAGATVALAGLLLLRHIGEGRLGDRLRRSMDLALLPLLAISLTYVVARRLV